MKSKNKILITTLIAVIAVVLIILISFIHLRKNQTILSTNTDKISSIIITEWKGDTINFNDINIIKDIINYLTSIETTNPSLYLGKPDDWSYRISIYGSTSDNSSVLRKSLYITSDKIVYTNNFKYIIKDFDNNNFLKIIKQQ